MTRSEAIALGLKRYANGKKCPKGHASERYVSTGSCVLCLALFGLATKERYREHKRQYAQKRYWENPIASNLRAKLWREENPDRQKALNKSWHARNPNGRIVHEANRRSRKHSAGGSHTVREINALMEKQKFRCVYCNLSLRRKRQVDHIVPIAAGGTNDIGNIQLLCPDCNWRKHTKSSVTFARSLGLLL